MSTGSGVPGFRGSWVRWSGSAILGAALLHVLHPLHVLPSPVVLRAEPQRRPTFAADIAPILHANCVSCHRPGRPAPFSLLSYEDARARGKEIVEAAASRHMPPWRAAAARGYPALRGARRLSDRQINAIRNWVANGMPAGDLGRTPLPPVFHTGWVLGLPDLTLSLPRPISMPAGSADRVFNIVLALNFPDDRLIQAIDFQPTSSGVLGHALLLAVPADAVVDDADTLPGFAGLLGAGPLVNPADRLVNADRSLTTLGVWVPGGLPGQTPDGSAMRLPRRTNLVVQLHARASDTGAIEDGRVAIYFAKTASRGLAAIEVPPGFGIASGLDIPAGQARVVVKDAFTLPVAVEAFGARGHAHRLGRDLKLTATLPNGSTRGLLWIDRWDPDWQESYYFEDPVRLPAGTTIHAEFTYDNSAANPRSPTPPRRVTWGPGLSSEIASLALIVAAPADADAATLADARAAHLREQLLRSVRR